MNLFLQAQDKLRNKPLPTQIESFREFLEVRPQVYHDLFVAQDWAQLNAIFMRGFHHLQITMYSKIDQDALFHLNAFLNEFLFYWTRPNFGVPLEYVERWLAMNPCIANAVAISAFRTTDAQCSIILGQSENNLLRLLTLYNARCEYQIPLDIYFNANPWIASLWWNYAIGLYQGGMASELVHSNLRKHLAYGDRITELRNFHNVSFGATYIDPVLDRKVRERVNLLVQAQVAKFDVTAYHNTPDPRHIAFVSGCWAQNHSVWRNQACFLEALKAAGYRLTLVHCGAERPDLQRDHFDDHKRVWVNQQGGMEMQEVLTNTFGMVYFPDVGMTMESIFLANFRLAPVMVASYGHSSSTFGSLVDHFIGSRDIEEDITERTGVPAQDRYSENLILIPGWGIGNTMPTYQRKEWKHPTDDATCLIGCSWFGQKVTYASLKLLVRIRDEVVKDGRKVKFRLFSGGALSANLAFIMFCIDVAKVLGQDAEVAVPMGYDDYMDSLAECAFAIDDVSFGGCNTVADSIWLGQPIVSRPGKHWRNTIGSYLAHRAGNRVPLTDDDLVTEVVRMANYRRWPYRGDDLWTAQILTNRNRETGRGFLGAVNKILLATYPVPSAAFCSSLP